MAFVRREPHVGPAAFDDQGPGRGVFDDPSGLQDASDIAVTVEERQGLFQGRGGWPWRLTAARDDRKDRRQGDREIEASGSAVESSTHSRMIDALSPSGQALFSDVFLNRGGPFGV